MNITEYRLTLTCDIDGNEIEKELIYRGNENITIKEKLINYCDNEKYLERRVSIPRNILEAFIEMIK